MRELSLRSLPFLGTANFAKYTSDSINQVSADGGGFSSWTVALQRTSNSFATVTNTSNPTSSSTDLNAITDTSNLTGLRSRVTSSGESLPSAALTIQLKNPRLMDGVYFRFGGSDNAGDLSGTGRTRQTEIRFSYQGVIVHSVNFSNATTAPVLYEATIGNLGVFADSIAIIHGVQVAPSITDWEVRLFQINAP